MKGSFSQSEMKSIQGLHAECLRDASETWAVKVENMARLGRMERLMVRWMCGVHLKSRKASAELNSRLGIECITDVVRRSRLRWFGHVERKDSDV